MAEELETMFKRLSKAEDCGSPSLMRKHLTREVFDKLKEKKTASGGTLGDCIKSGVVLNDSVTGVKACDPEAYSVFADLFDGVIRDYHGVPQSTRITHPVSDFGNIDELNLKNLDPDNKFVISTRIRVGRSHVGFGFPPTLNKEQRLEMEAKTKEALDDLAEDLKGTYHSLEEMDSATQTQLRNDHFLFRDDNRVLREAGCYDDWPSGRGIFFNRDKTFLIWLNEEDHLRLISMQKGHDVENVYKRLVKGVKAIEKKLTFARDKRLGFLNFCPSNLGTALRASVHIRIPNVSTRKDFKDICDQHCLAVRGIHGEYTEGEGGVYDLSNKRKLGLTELQAVTEMYNGVKEIIKLETEMSW